MAQIIYLGPTPPEEPQPIEIEFRSTPSGAGVYRAGTDEQLGVTPWTLTAAPVDRIDQFEVRLDGYQPQTTRVPLSRSALVSLSLTPNLPAPPAQAPAPVAKSRPRPHGKHAGTGTGTSTGAPAQTAGSAAPTTYTPEERDGVLDPLAD